MYFIPVSKDTKLCESTHLYTQHFHNWGFYHKDTFLSHVFYSESHYAQFLTVSTPGRHTASAGGTLPSQWQDKLFLPCPHLKTFGVPRLCNHKSSPTGHPWVRGYNHRAMTSQQKCFLASLRRPRLSHMCESLSHCLWESMETLMLKKSLQIGK